MTSHCASPVSQVYVPESSGTRLWMWSWWNAPLFFRSYLRPALIGTVFLIQVIVALGSEMVQARVTVSPSNATVLCGFSRISTVNMEDPKLGLIIAELIDNLFLFPFLISLAWIISKLLKKRHACMQWKLYAITNFYIMANKDLKLSIKNCKIWQIQYWMSIFENTNLNCWIVYLLLLQYLC